MERNNYNRIERLLHRIVLGSRNFNDFLFNLESKRFKNTILFEEQAGPVFITGLARSGTTTLLNVLHESSLLHALTYQDMPFVLAPNSWAQLRGKNSNNEKKERAHLDGVLVDSSSPEALEEVFWKMYYSNQFIGANTLQTSSLSDDFIKDYEAFRKLVIYRSGNPSARYLAKNNNLILRLRGLSSYIPSAKFIVTFRNPLDHAASLLNQHSHFCLLQKEDPFVLDYMNWIGHHEFGLNQKTFDLGNSELLEQMNEYSKSDINFWLLNWLNYYTFLVNNLPHNLFLIQFENLCSNPNLVYEKLNTFLHIPSVNGKLVPFNPKVRRVTGINDSVLLACNQIYKQLLHVESNL
jgi:hypothetical protein